MIRSAFLVFAIAVGALSQTRTETAKSLFNSNDYTGVVALLDKDFRAHQCNGEEYKYYAAAQLMLWEQSGELVQDLSRKFLSDTRIQFARKALDLALDLNPSDLESVFLQGVASARMHDWFNAENHFTQVLEANSTLRTFGYQKPLPMLLEALKEQGKFDRAESLPSNSKDWDAKRQLFEIEVLKGDQEQTIAAYTDLLKDLDETHAELLFDEASLIAGEDEKAAWNSSENAARFLSTFWKKRDPNLANEANERLTEHYKRFLHAREYYAKALDRSHLDDRGDIYVRLGPPTRIYYGGDGSITKDYEAWVYSDLGLHFDFVQKFHNYELAPITDALAFGATPFQRKNDVDALVTDLRSEHIDYFRISRLRSSPGFAEQIAQQQYYENTKNNNLQFFDTKKYLPISINAKAACFKAENGLTRLDLYYMTPLNGLVFETEPELGKKYTSQVQVATRLFDESFQEVSSSEYERQVLAGETDIAKLYYLDEIRMVVKPGTYLLAFQIKNGDKTGVYQFPITIPSFDQSSLAVSDIQLAVRVGDSKIENKFVKPGSSVRVMPNPAEAIVKRRNLALYYEIYGLTVDDAGNSSYEVTYNVETTAPRTSFFRRIGRWISGNKVTSLATTTTRTGHSSLENEFVSLDIRNLPGGSARLEIRVKDLNSGMEKTSSLPLQIE